MTILFSILIGLVAIALFCVFMDLLTLLYSIAWIIPVVILAVFVLRLIFRPDFRTKVGSVILGQKGGRANIPTATVATETELLEQLNSLIDQAIVDGAISERERRAIATKGVEMGIAPEEVEAYIASRMSEQK